MSARLSSLILVSTLCACGASNSPAGDGGADLSVPADLARASDLAVAIADLAVTDLVMSPAADLVTIPDIAGPDYAGFTFCSGTRVAATCAQAFFQPVAMCFSPAGACRSAQNGDTTAACWQAGTMFSTTYQPGTGSNHLVWTGGAPCMEGDLTPRKGKSPLFALTAGGSKLVYDQDSGDVTCPDGSHVFIGSTFGDCGSLQALLQPDIKACQAGLCP